MSNNNNPTRPESVETKIKHAIFHIINLPIRAAEGTEAWIEKEDGKLFAKIKLDVDKFRKDWRNHVNYSHDAVTASKHTATFIVPELFHQEAEQIAAIQNSTEGVIAKDQSIDGIVHQIKKKIEASTGPVTPQA